jgi:CheY-like chemotaxis protein
MGETGTRRARALVVDDGPVERLAGKVLLEKLGFDTAAASSGEEALAWLKTNGADLVLCDISMPGMGGIGLLEALGGHMPMPRFVMVTSHADAALARTALDKGASAWLCKPLRFDALRETVAAVMAP